MPFFSISCVRIETAAGSCLLCLLLCCCLCLRGWLCGIPEWNNSQSESHNMAARPTPKAERRCHLFALPHFFASSANCFFFISSSSRKRRKWREEEQQQRLRLFLCPGNAIRIVCLGSFSPCQAGRQAGRRQIACGMSTMGVGGSGKSGLGDWSGSKLGDECKRARPLLPECALVNKIYCEDARVSCSCLGKQRGREEGWDGGT